MCAQRIEVLIELPSKALTRERVSEREKKPFIKCDDGLTGLMNLAEVIQ